MTPADLGFSAEQGLQGDFRWTVHGRDGLVFRIIETLDDLRPVETVQREVMGVNDYDLCPASQLVLVPDTGGFVLGAFVSASDGESLAGFSIGWGAWFEQRPRLCSDMLAVSPEYRALKIGSSLKRLQAVLALERGFEEIVWTVDPLRAVNAHLNFRVLGARADRYERNRYGDYGSGLYGTMPSDRLHVTWNIAEPGVQERILDPRAASMTPVAAHGASLRIPLPRDIDTIVKHEPERALAHRFGLRSLLEQAFADGFQVIDFQAADQNDTDAGWLILTEQSS